MEDASRGSEKAVAQRGIGDPGDPRRGMWRFANREVLDVLLGGPVTFGRANVLSSGRGSNGRAKIWRILAMEVFRLVF